ncbi:MAG: immune inhibitor A [Gammaproteobacteria bacterium]|nr:immune inhibitor A [Gammaproteobacteria bacterium]
MNLSKNLLASLVAAGLLSAMPARANTAVDVGLIDRDRIEYWLIKRGELSESASAQEKAKAVEFYLGNISNEHLKPELISKLENRATQLKSIKLLNKNANYSANVLAVLIDFNDLPHYDNGLSSQDTQMFYPSYPVEHYQAVQFSRDGYEGPSGQTLASAYQYFQGESGGTFTFDGTTYGWVRAEKAAAYYGANEGQSRNANASELIIEAVQKAVTENNIDLSEFDRKDLFDLDGDGITDEPDGFIDHVMVYHSSIGEEAGGGVLGSDAIWSHKSFINVGAGVPADQIGVAIEDGSCSEATTPCIRVLNYTIQPIDAAVGVIAHEFGHDLGLPDEYDTASGNSVSPVEGWSIMSRGSYAGLPAGTSPTGYSPYAKEYLQNRYGGSWYNQVEINFSDLNASGQTVNLFEAVNKSEVNQIKVNLPTGTTGPYSGSNAYYSAAGDDLNNSMDISVELPTAASLVLSMKAHWNIEQDWDYARLTISDTAIAGSHTNATNPWATDYPEQYGDVVNYITGVSKDISGAEGEAGWVNLTFDLTPYAGQSVVLKFEYITDSNTGGYGIVIDDLSVAADGSEVFSDGAEGTTAVLNGFQRVDGVSTRASHNYYIQLRSYNGIDSGLASSSYQRGVLVWYRDNAIANNNVSEHMGSCLICVVDADQTSITMGNASTQLRDATFNLAQRPQFVDLKNYSNPLNPAIGVNLPGVGFGFDILSQTTNSTEASLLLRADAILLPEATFSLSLNGATVTFFNNSNGGSGTLTYEWDFGDGTTSLARAPSHTYQESGQYTVTLTVTDTQGNTDSRSQSVNVTVPSQGGSGGGGSVTFWMMVLLSNLFFVRKRRVIK